MKQIKRPHKKVPINPSELCKHHKNLFARKLLLCVLVCNRQVKNTCLFLVGKVKEQSAAGDRPDNQWLQYDSSCLPRTQQDWDQCVFVEKTHWGYYCWPRFIHNDASVSHVAYLIVPTLICYIILIYHHL